MYTPAEERSELLVRKLWKHQLMAFWACVSRFPSLPGSTPSLFLSLCGFIHVMECLEMKPRHSRATIPCRKSRQEIRKKSSSETSNIMKLRMRIAIVRATHLCMHPRISRIPTSMSRMSQHPQWVDGAGLGLLYHWTNNKSYLKLEERFQEENIECTTI